MNDLALVNLILALVIGVPLLFLALVIAFVCLVRWNLRRWM